MRICKFELKNQKSKITNLKLENKTEERKNDDGKDKEEIKK